MPDLIDEFVNIVKPYVDAPDEFLEAGGYSVISSLLGSFFKSPWLPHGAQRPNLWIILSSIPGRMRRSSLQYAVTNIYKQVKFEIIRDDLIAKNAELPEKEKIKSINGTAWNRVRDTLIEEGSVEGLMDHIGTAKLDTYHLSSTEFGGILLKMYGKGYEKGSAVLLSKLVYGEGGKVVLSQRDKEKKSSRIVPTGLYVDAFCGMQEPQDYLRKASIKQGLVRRLLIIYVPRNYRWIPPINLERKLFRRDLKSFAEKIIKETKKARDKANENIAETTYWDEEEKNYVEVRWFPDVLNAINLFDKGMAEMVDDNPSLENIARQSRWEALAKLSVCREIAKGKIMKDSSNDVNYIVVGLDSYKKAKAYLDKIAGSTKKYIGKIGEDKIRPKSVVEPREKIRRIIEEHMPLGASQTILLHKTGWSSKEIGNYLLDLQRMDEIELDKTDTGQVGRRAKIWKLKIEKSKPEEQEKKIDVSLDFTEKSNI